ncbi:hypothetical protein [Bradyrhizobium sp. 33ap4]|uniref:hypothetical protein n=1 Tax=Bradyrhizobium sp. 33ap4 TaxID=3061630 RepID=UPI002931DF43|nr:hypothetical protein [Bradyrhizobium sp. 33ap4]
MEVLDEIATLGLIKKQVRRSGPARLAIAFWGPGAARNLGISERRDCVEIICNLSQGGTNPDEIRTLMGLPQVGCDRNIGNNETINGDLTLEAGRKLTPSPPKPRSYSACAEMMP